MSQSLSYERIMGGEDRKPIWLMEIEQNRNTEQSVRCFGVFHRECFTQSPCYPGTDYMAQAGFELVTNFLLQLLDYMPKPPCGAPTPPLVNSIPPSS